MKIYYPNDLCLCGSGKKYKNCCAKKAIKSLGNFNGLPFYKINEDDEDDEYYVDPRGAVVFKDESKQPVLNLEDGSTIKMVLVEFYKNGDKYSADIL